MIDKVFQLKENNTSVSTELLGGLTTFLAMAYILFVNTNILSASGMNPVAVFAATALASVVSCLIMGLYANLPIGLAPGMGMNAIFSYTIVLGMGYTWAEALAATLIAGIIFVIISATGLRNMIINAIPESLKIAISVGIGFFITFIGFQEAGIIVNNDATLVGLGDLKAPNTLLALFGLLVIVVLMARKVRGSVFLGIVITAIAGLITGLSPLPSGLVSIPTSALKETFGQAIFNIPTLFGHGSLLNTVLIVFVILFVAFFDAAGTIVSVTRAANLVDDKGQIKNVGKAFMSDSLATVFGSIFGTSSTTSYIESLAGIAAGARTGLAAVTTGLLFLVFMFFSPLLAVITSAVTAPALIIVGSLMAKEVTKIDFDDFPVAVSAFLTMLLIVLSYNISKGLAFGFIIFTIAMLVSGRGKSVPKPVFFLDIFFLIFLFFTNY